MPRRIVILRVFAMVAAALAAAASFSPVQGMPPAQAVAAVIGTAKLTDPHKLFNDFTNSTVSVIVDLTPPQVMAHTDFSSKASLHILQAEIKKLQKELLDSLSTNDVKVGHRFENIAGFSAEVTARGLQALQAHSKVVAIEPVYILHAHLAQGIPLIHGMTYRSTYNGAGLSIAICDTGIDYTHVRLGGGGFPNGKVLGGFDFGDNDSNPIPNTQAHGTCCAGIAAGDLGTVGDYIGGVAYNAKLYSLKISNGTTGNATTAAMVSAWDWCTTHKNDNPSYPIMVISTSFGGGQYFSNSTCDASAPSMTTAANNAVAAGITVLASSGNDGFCDSLAWPACISSVISVGAVYDAAFGDYFPCVSSACCAPKFAGGCTTGWYCDDVTAPDKVTSYANIASFLTLLAPGNQCYTLDITGAQGYSTGDYYDSFGGTSAACPYAAGAVACLQSAAKALTGSYLTPSDVKNRLVTYGDNITDTKVAITKPRVNLERAIQNLTPVPIANFTGSPTNGLAPLTVVFTNLSANATNFSWSFGDGNASTSTNVNNTYTNAGTYTVQLTAIGFGQTNRLTRTNYIVVTNPPPTLANFTGGPTNGMAPLAVAFNNLSTSATNYAWDFGDGKTSSATNPANTYTNAGTYSVSLTVIGNTGTNALVRTNYIVVTNPPPVVPNFAGSPTNGAAPLAVTFTNLSTGATNYNWNFGDGGVSGGANPAHTFTNAGTYSVTLLAFGFSGSNSLTRTNYILATNAPPVIVTQPQNQVVDAGSTATFTVSATGTPPLAYQWRRAGTHLSGATASVLTRTNAQVGDIGTYSVVVTNLAGTAISSNASLVVNILAGVISVTGDPYLQNFDGMGPAGTVTPTGWYVGTGTVAISSTNVTVGDGSSMTGGNYNYGTSGSSDRALGSLASSSTQRDTEARFVNVSGSLILSFNISYTGEQWRVGGNGSVNNDLVMQYSTDGVNFSAMGSQFNFNTPLDSGTAGPLDGNAASNRVTSIGGIFTPSSPITNNQVFYLRWADSDSTSSDNAMAVDDFIITFTLTNPPPMIVTQPQNQTVGLGSNTSFSVTASGIPPFSYQWFFNATNTLATATNASLSLSNVQTSDAGSYLVIVTNAGGAATSSLANLTVTQAPPVIAFAGAPTSGLVPLTVNFTNQSSGATNYAWTFGDGNTSSFTNPADTYSNAGSYSVTLTAIGPGGTNSLTLNNYIVVTNPPPPPVVANFTAGPTNGLAPLAVSFTNQSSGASSYTWDFGDGNTSVSNNPANTYSNAGTFSVTLTAVGLGGTNTLTQTNYVTVTNLPPPPVVADFAGAPTSGVAPLLVAFANQSSGATNFAWDFGDGNASALTNPATTYSNAGIFSVTLTAVGPGGTNVLIRANYVVVTNPPPPPVIADFEGSPTNGTVPLTVTFTNLSSGATGYLWDFGDGNTSISNQAENTYSNAGTFSVTLTATGPGGTNTLARTNYIVVSNPPPPPVIAEFEGAPTNGIVPLTVTFTNQSTGATNFTWDFGDGNTSVSNNPANTFSNAGTFSVTLTAIGPGGTNVLTRTNYIVATNPPPPPVIANFTGSPTNGPVPLTVTFTNESSGSTNFAWDFGDGNTSGSTNPVKTYSNAGSYTVTLRATGESGVSVLSRTNYIVLYLPAVLVATPASLDFGLIAPGATAQAALSVSNAGGSLLTGSAAIGSGSFTIVFGAAFQIAPAEATNVVVSFAPAVQGAFTNEIAFSGDGGALTNRLTGRAINSPMILAPAHDGTNFLFSFSSLAGFTYVVEYKDQLEDEAWQSLESVEGDGTVKQISLPASSAAQRFYRLQVQ